jgi:hypothetical protein
MVKSGEEKPPLSSSPRELTIFYRPKEEIKIHEARVIEVCLSLSLWFISPPLALADDAAQV